jgi:hypothetical protein
MRAGAFPNGTKLPATCIFHIRTSVPTARTSDERTLGSFGPELDDEVSEAATLGPVREVRTEIEIGASPERVWSVLMDFCSYAEWNPFIRRISGEPAVGSRLEVRIEPPEGRGLTFKPSVRKAEVNREFAWLGHLVLPGIFDGEHHLELQPRNGGTLFVQREEFKGILVPLFGRGLEKTEHGFERMNVALKERAEA